MKITFEPTKQKGTEPQEVLYPTISVSQPNDDLNIEEVVKLLKGALVTWGFHQNTVDEAFGEKDDHFGR